MGTNFPRMLSLVSTCSESFRNVSSAGVWPCDCTSQTHMSQHLRNSRFSSRWVAAFCVVLSSALHAHGQTRSPAYLVRRVIDGDTIDLTALGRVSLLGIDAPELDRDPERSTPLAREAQQRLSGLLLNRWIRLEYE